MYVKILAIIWLAMFTSSFISKLNIRSFFDKIIIYIPQQNYTNSHLHEGNIDIINILKYVLFPNDLSWPC